MTTKSSQPAETPAPGAEAEIDPDEPVVDPTTRRLIDAALESFARVGYHGASTREISLSAGMSNAALYIRFPSKALLLQRISVDGHLAVLAAVTEIDRHDLPPVEHLAGLIANFAAWHAEHHQLARVVQYELGSLEEEAAREVFCLRHEIEDRFRAAIQAAADATGVTIDDLGLATRAVMSLAIDLSRWYAETNRRTPAEVGQAYATYCLRMLGLPLPAAD